MITIASKSLILFLQISLFLILLTIPSSLEEVISGVRCPQRERLALLKFKSQLIDGYGRLSTWGNYQGGDDGHDKDDCCKWEGVFCDNRTNRVVGLDLSGSFLRGNISTSFLELADLNYLDLSFNNFNRSEIPEFICSLGKLRHLNLEYSSFGGPVPHCLGNLSKLQFLDVGGNWLYDTSIDWLSGFQSLEYLDLSRTNLQGLAIPDALGNLTSLSQIYIVNTSLEGKIPDALGKLTSLSHLELPYNNLEGISNSLWNITSLSFLHLHYNQLRGEFHGSLNLSVPNLQVLLLSGNMLSGHVPILSSCPSLRTLSLDHNMFSGSLTESIGYLSQIDTIILGSNHLEGSLSEAHLFNLTKLRVLDLSFNSNLNVRINSSWNPPFQLESLYLASCKVGPRFPKWLQKQKRIRTLDISNAKISDSVPDSFWDSIRMCSTLNMSYNQIYGVVPDLSSITTLSIINLSSNKFNGSLPLLPPAVSNIDFSGNKFSGTIFSTCYDLRNLQFLDLSDNLFSIYIPQRCFMNLMSLNYLNLANNNFSGKIPNSIDVVCRVYSLHLRNNSFAGEISKSLKNCSNLIILDLGENNFTGEISDWLGQSMPELGVLILKSNNIHGSLPRSLCHLQKLQVLDISINNISGTIPECLNNFTLLSSKIDAKSDNRFFLRASVMGVDSDYIMWKGKESEYSNTLRFLTLIDLSNNNLVGKIPREITSLVGLIALNLSRNNLVGSIPRDIGQLELLNFLDFSKNKLSGGIPPTLAQLSHLGVLDLSFNNLSGKIPWDAHLQTFNASVYMGNPGLCGPPLVLKPCPEDETPTGHVDEMNNEEEDNIFNSRGFYVSMALGFIVAFWGVSGTLFLNKWCRTTIVKVFISVGDWLYVKIMINKNRLQRFSENC